MLVKQHELAHYIDHTVLKADATPSEIEKLCSEAKEFGFASVCVNPSQVALCSDKLDGTPVKVCTVIGFPLGATTTAVKVYETREAVANGADEIDMVLNVGAAKAGNHKLVLEEIKSVVQAADGRCVKVILETALLNDEEKVKACLLAQEAGATFVKTSTGFATGGATTQDVQLMRSTVGPVMGVKASGGVRDYQTAVMMLEAGATRLGTSSGVAIVSSRAVGGTGY